MQDHVGFDDFFQGRTKSRYQHGWEIRNESDGVRQNYSRAVRQLNRAKRRVESGEQHVRRQYARRRHAIKKRRLASIGVTDESDNRIRDALAAIAMQFTRAFDLFELAFDAGDTILDQAPVRFDLGLAWSTKEDRKSTRLHSSH